MVSNKVMDLSQVTGSKVMAMASSLVTAWTIPPTTADIITPVPMVQTAPTTNTRRATERTKSQSRTKRTVIMVSQVMGNKVTTTISSLVMAAINMAMVSNKVIIVSQVMGNKVTTTISSLVTAAINKAMVSNKVIIVSQVTGNKVTAMISSLAMARTKSQSRTKRTPAETITRTGATRTLVAGQEGPRTRGQTLSSRRHSANPALGTPWTWGTPTAPRPATGRHIRTNTERRAPSRDAVGC